MTGLDNHLHAHRRGARCWRRTRSCPIIQAYAAHGRRRRRDPRHLARRAASSPRSPTACPSEQRVDDALAELGELAKTPEANIIKLPNISRLDPAAQGRDRRAAGPGLRRCPTTRTTRRPTRRRTSAPATTRSRAARSTRCCARATPTAARPRRSRTTPASTRTRWAPGRPTRRPTSRTWAPTTSAPTRSPSSSTADDTLRDRARRRRRHRPPCCKESVPVLAGEVVDAHRACASPRCASSSPRRSPAPRPRTCCSRCTSRPR